MWLRLSCSSTAPWYPKRTRQRHVCRPAARHCDLWAMHIATSEVLHVFVCPQKHFINEVAAAPFDLCQHVWIQTRHETVFNWISILYNASRNQRRIASTACVCGGVIVVLYLRVSPLNYFISRTTNLSVLWCLLLSIENLHAHIHHHFPMRLNYYVMSPGVHLPL